MPITPFTLDRILEPEQLQEAVAKAGQEMGWRPHRKDITFNGWTESDPTFTGKITERGMDLRGMYLRAVRVTRIYDTPTNIINVHTGMGELAFATHSEVAEFLNNIRRYTGQLTYD